MNKKEKKQFEKQLKNDVIKYLCQTHANLNDYKDINKALKDFNNKYYTEIKYQVKCTKDMEIVINYKED